MIAILCPTRGRPEQCRRLMESVNATAQSSEYVVRFGVSDVERDWVGGENLLSIAHRYPDNLPTAHKWNLLAQEAMKAPNTKLFMLGADDMIFTTPLWDKALIDDYNALENKVHVYALQDSRDPEGTPHPIVTREWIEAMGYFVPPIFLHWFVDSWTVAVARRNNCFTHMKDYLLVHDKPSDRGEADETHNRIRDWGWHSRDQWVNERCQHILDHEVNRLSCAISVYKRALMSQGNWVA